MLLDTLRLWRLHPRPVERYPLDIPLSIGRHEDNRLRFQEDDVSRFHARIEQRPEGLVLVDAGSRNGTFLGGRRVGVSAVQAGAVIRVGQTVLWIGPERSPAELVREAAESAMSSSEPLIIRGEVGVGKRSLARRIHRLAERTGPFILAERTIDEPLARAARNGTIVIEEAEDLKTSALLATKHQAHLIAIATEQRLDGFRCIELPPLRERLDELPEALAQFASSNGTPVDWNADVLEALACHPFPLNFRGLEVLARQLAQTGQFITLDQLPDSMRSRFREAREAFVKDLTREQLIDALARHHGNVRRIAQEFGLHRVQVYRLFAAMGLDPDAYRTGETPAGEERRTIA